MTVLVATGPSARRPYAGAADDTWFSELYQQTFESAFRFARLLTRDSDLAADIVSDVYLRAWVNRASLKGIGNPTAWILTVTRNRVTDEFRARKANVELDEIPEPEDAASAEIEPELTDAQKQFLQQAIQRLTPEQQQVVFLRFYQQMAHEQVAKELGRSPNAVRAIQFRALARLRKLLEVEGVR